MFDLTINSSNEAGGRVRYELGPGNWQDRRIPDIHHPGATLQIAENRLIDVVILGDGFETVLSFEAQLAAWLSDFSKLAVYEKFAGAFRIRALYEPSGEPASASRNSFYRCRIKDDDSGISFGGNWWAADDDDGRVFRERLYAAVDSFAGVNTRRYPDDLALGDGKTAIRNSTLRDVYRNLVVCLFVRTAISNNASGLARAVPRPDPDAHRKVRVALGANRIHEFSHAFGLLSDEYINGRQSKSDRVNHPTKSVFTLSNLGFSNVDGQVAWKHLGPWGKDRRQAAGNDPDPLVGWLWAGGGKHRQVWHAEYRCLMNGRHDNFKFTQVQADDPTANPDGSYTDENGASLRDGDRFCLWCQEIVTIRILEKTDSLRRAGDPADLSAAGMTWWNRWQTELRDHYWQLFDVSQQIVDHESGYAGMTPGAGGEPLWQSDLYSAYATAKPAPSNPVADPDDDELYMLLLG